MEPKQNAGRKTKRIVLIMIIAAVILFLSGGIAFSLWHSRHYTILLDLKTVEIMEPAGDSENPYVAIRINGKARQWWFDTATHTFRVQKHYSGDLPFTVQPSDVLTTSFLKSAEFEVMAFCRKNELSDVGLGVTAVDGSWSNDIGYRIMQDEKRFRFVTVDDLPVPER